MVYTIGSLRVIRHAQINEILVGAAQKAIYELHSVLPPDGACFITAAVHGRDKRLTARVFEAANFGGSYAGGMHLYLNGAPATFMKTQPHLKRGDRAFSEHYRNWHDRDIWDLLAKCEILGCVDGLHRLELRSYSTRSAHPPPLHNIVRPTEAKDDGRR